MRSRCKLGAVRRLVIADWASSVSDKQQMLNECMSERENALAKRSETARQWRSCGVERRKW